MSAVQRLGDPNDAGAPTTGAGQGFVFCNGIPVVLVGSPVAGHGDGPHRSPVTTGGSAFNYINGSRIILTGNSDSCGHARVGGSPNVFSD